LQGLLILCLFVMLSGSWASEYWTYVQWADGSTATRVEAGREHTMSNVFYVIGVVVVAFAILGYLGLP
jgi:hypothetical protein